MRTYHLDDTERMIQNVLGNRREITVHGSSAFPCASYLDYYKKSAYPWHWHDEMEIAYIQEGEAEAIIDGRKYRLLEGDGYFANCRVLHAVAGVGEEEMRMPNILFHPSLLYGTRDSVFWGKYMEPLVMSPGVSHVILRAEVPWQKDILELTAESFALMTRENYGYEFRVRDRLSEIMLLFCEHREELPAVPGNAEGRTHQEMGARPHHAGFYSDALPQAPAACPDRGQRVGQSERVSAAVPASSGHFAHAVCDRAADRTGEAASRGDWPASSGGGQPLRFFR